MVQTTSPRSGSTSARSWQAAPSSSSLLTSASLIRSLGRRNTIHTSEFLSFADIEPVAIPALPITQHLAEKVHAYTRAYGPSGEQSTRPKDLVDILLIAGSEEIDAASLREALERTFTSRKRQALPPSLPPA